MDEKGFQDEVREIGKEKKVSKKTTKKQKNKQKKYNWSLQN